MSDFALVVPTPGGAGSVREAQDRRAGSGSRRVVVRHRAVGLNVLDVYHRSDLYPWPVERDLVPGLEAAGVVEAVDGLATGDRVA